MESVIEERKKRLFLLRQQYTEEKQETDTLTVDKEKKDIEEIQDIPAEGASSEERLDRDLEELKKRTDHSIKRLLRERILKEAIEEPAVNNDES
ncbi:Ntc20 [Kluyveromyces lactis]|nr:Ntc20 [Kluyveromyces lactis]